MRRGEYEAAWRLSDIVLQARAPDDFNRPWTPYHTRCVWNGTPLSGRRVLVRCYHGLGDTLQFIRYAPLLRRRCPWVGVEAQPELLGLLARCAGIDALVPLGRGDALPFEVDVECMELPHALRTLPATVPASVPYLVPGPTPSGLSEREAGAPRHVGLLWRAGGWDARRSVPLGAMGPLLSVPGVRFVGLQLGPEPAEAGLMRKSNVADRSVDDIERLAAILRRLDVFVTVDTMAAHLAGGLGVPTCLLLHTDADWRWGSGGTTVWYPSLRLFRQHRIGEWAAPVAELACDLCRRLEALSPIGDGNDALSLE